jgi:hypothetical protein
LLFVLIEQFLQNTHLSGLITLANQEERQQLFRHQDYFGVFVNIGHVMPKPQGSKDNDDYENYQDYDMAAITARLSIYGHLPTSHRSA